MKLLNTSTAISNILVALLLCFFSSGALRAEAYPSPEMLPNPTRSSTPGYVCNPDGFLTPQQQAVVNDSLIMLERRSSVEMIVVVVNSIGDADPVQYAVELGQQWGVGKKSNSNGVVLLLVMDSHSIALQAGYGMEGVLTDALSNAIIRKIIIPEMRKDNLLGAVLGTIGAVARVVSSPEAAAEVLGSSNKLKEQTDDNEEAFLWLLAAGMMMCLVFAACYYVATALKARRQKDWYERSKVWRKALVLLFITGLFGCGVGLAFYLLALLKYRRWRTRRRRCHHCGAKMKRLNEQEDNQFLTSGQDKEEQLGTVDYDVWKCPDCGEIEIFPYAASTTKYEPCPRCHAHTFGMKYERVLQLPDSRRPGKGTRVWVCEHCGYTENRDFTIPPGGGGGGALAAGAALGALGALSGNRSGGGGGISFGGGSFGGGGASGNW